MNKIWVNRPPHIKEPILFHMKDGGKVVGFYQGYNDPELAFEIATYILKKGNIKQGNALVRKCNIVKGAVLKYD